ncbi:TRAP transporter substrate-binding protein DctP [Saccharospirillum impatiens]|uniref:TRAP transporter substrate-binding protein n=1 Tax=Saccharospirillum impatiens TaxID=169438 RepID=UPI001FE1AF14|nr:TRAP transporter substrate-binding protein DctP [Saccharospirillum impatiens]
MRSLTVTAILSITAVMAQAEELKISTQYPDGNAVLNELRRAGEAIKAQTEGRVDIRYYPGGVMGDDQAVQRKIRIGQLQGAFVQSGALANAFRDSQVLNAPLLFRNYDEVDAVRAQLDGDIEQGFAEGGWQTFGLIEAGFAYGMSQQPITSMDSLKARKLWLPANDPFSEQIARAFGINPIVLNIGDVLTALQTGAIDAIVAPPVGAITLQWYSRVDYLTDAPFMYTYGVLALSDRAFSQLTAADQAIVEAEFGNASATIDRQTRQDNLRSFAALETLGIEIVEPGEADRSALEAESEAATRLLIERDQFSAGIYEKVSDILVRHRDAL